MDERCRTEILELHQFFENWFAARLDRTEENFRRLSSVLAPDFEHISPEAVLSSREKLLEGLWEFYGSYRDQAVYRIQIKEYRGRPLEEGLHLVNYEEWEEREGGRKGRLTTALFRPTSGARNGVEWLHVHEVWLPSSSAPRF